MKSTHLSMSRSQYEDLGRRVTAAGANVAKTMQVEVTEQRLRIWTEDGEGAFSIRAEAELETSGELSTTVETDAWTRAMHVLEGHEEEIEIRYDGQGIELASAGAMARIGCQGHASIPEVDTPGPRIRGLGSVHELLKRMARMHQGQSSGPQSIAVRGRGRQIELKAWSSRVKSRAWTEDEYWIRTEELRPGEDTVRCLVPIDAAMAAAQLACHDYVRMGMGDNTCWMSADEFVLEMLLDRHREQAKWEQCAVAQREGWVRMGAARAYRLEDAFNASRTMREASGDELIRIDTRNAGIEIASAADAQERFCVAVEGTVEQERWALETGAQEFGRTLHGTAGTITLDWHPESCELKVCTHWEVPGGQQSGGWEHRLPALRVPDEESDSGC